MAFIKGQSGNPTGRKPGSKNKIGAQLRQRIEVFLSEQFHLITEDFEHMQPADRHKLFVALLPYCISKRQELSIEAQLGQLSDQQIDQILDTLEATP
jgi:hypothetical protein